MKKYEVSIMEVAEYVITVDANDENDASNKALEMLVQAEDTSQFFACHRKINSARERPV